MFQYPGYTRRQVMQVSLATGIAATLPSETLLASAATRTITKAIPSSRQKLPVIGIGTNAFQLKDQATLRDVLKRFHEFGARVIDTSARYGESESAIGQALADLKLRKRMFIVSKVMGHAPPVGGNNRPSPPGSLYAEASFEHSLQVLKTDYLDVLMVHGMIGVEDMIPLMLKWKKAGKIRYIGASGWQSEDHAQLIECMKTYPLDFVEINYSIANREAAKTVFPVALERKVGVITNVPLGGRGANNMVGSRKAALPPWAAELSITSWAQFMLKYVVSHPAVTCAIPGSTKVEHLEDNQHAGIGKLPDQAMRQQMEAYWDQAG
jgi:aryl-alcohol dehydrogenase-like predicted oxidoreductase